MPEIFSWQIPSPNKLGTVTTGRDKPVEKLATESADFRR